MWIIFQVFKEFHFPWTPKSLYQIALTHPKLDSVSIIKLLGTKFIISHTFVCKRFLFFACPGKFDKKHHKGDVGGHRSIYS